MKTKREKVGIIWKPSKQFYKIYLDPKAKSLFPTWWDRLLSWIGFKRNQWYIKRLIKSYEEIAGKPLVEVLPIVKSDKRKAKLMQKFFDYTFSQVWGSRILKTPWGILMWTPDKHLKRKTHGTT